ncbi:mannosyl transferase [Botrytis cinerea]
MQRLGIGILSNLSIKYSPDMQVQTPQAHGLSGMPARTSMSRSGPSLGNSGISLVDGKMEGDAVGDINKYFPMDSEGAQSHTSSLNSSSASSSRDSIPYPDFKSLSSIAFGKQNGSNMLVAESLIFFATACILYVLSSQRKTHTRRPQNGSHKRTSSTNSPSNITKFLHNPLAQISHLLSCSSSTSSSSSSISLPTPPHQPPKTQPGPQKPAYALPPLKPTSPHPTSMGLKRLDKSNWLTIDSTYLPEHELRASLLETHGPCVLQVLPPAVPATYELLEMVIEFLLDRYPDDFSLVDENTILNKLTGETSIIGSKCENPLETATRLCMEDFNILLQDPSEEDGEWNLMASATLFPAGWKLQERIGSSMAVLHRPVPGWKEKLGKSVNRYFTHLTPRTCMERSNIFIQTTPILFQDIPEAPPSPSFPLTPSDIYVRRERQTFTRLPKSNAVLFTVRTYMEKLVDQNIADMEAMAKQIRGWDGDLAKYKGVDIWGDVTLAYCDGKVEEKLRGLRRDSGIDMGCEDEVAKS